jgi:type IX secretion system substrate protein
MRVLIIIIVLCFSSFSLIAEWEKTDKSYLSSDTLVGNMRYILDENALIVESKHSIKKVDLNTGKVIKEIVFDDTTHSFAVADDSLKQVFLIYDSLKTKNYDYWYSVVNFNNKDTIITGGKDLPYWDPEIDRNFGLLNDSLLIFTGNLKESHSTFRSNNPFFNIINLNSNLPLKESLDYGFYFDRYNLWNPRNNRILAVSDRYDSEGNKGGASYTKLKMLSLDSLKIKDLKYHNTKSNDSYVPRARFTSYTTSNIDNLVYYDYYYYVTKYSQLGEISYTKHFLNQITSTNVEVIQNINKSLGDCVIFSTDDKWLVSTKMRGENSVDFNIFDLEGELIFTDNISNVTNEQIICYTDSTYFFESGNKVLKYNPFDNNLTNVSEQNTSNLLYIYPNPSSKVLYINLTDIDLSSEFTVIDQKGDIIESISLDAETMQNQLFKLDVSRYPTGVYLVSLSNRTNTIIGKFIKE